MAGSEWIQQVRRVMGAAVKAGILAALRNLTKGNRTPAGTRRSTTRRSTTRRTTSRPAGQPTQTSDLRDYPGTPVLEYRPRNDGRPDPGEIVWAWVPYEENDGRGKDRPVLIVGHDGRTLLGLMLTSKDRDRDAAQEARAGRHWTDIGSGDWDAQRRPSEVRLDRVLRIEVSAVRREGAVLSRAKFDHVAAEVARLHTLRRT